MIAPYKLSELFTDYVENKEYYKNGDSTLAMIQNGAYDFLTYHCGILYNKITSDFNLNENLMNIFAQTFIKHFWNNRIGYDSIDTFYIKLSSFFEENLPLWAQFFNEAIINSGAMVDNISSLNTASNTTNNVHSDVHGTQTSSTENTTHSSVSNSGESTVENTNESTTDTKNSSTTTNKTNTNSVSANGSANSKTTTPQTGMVLPIKPFSTNLEENLEENLDSTYSTAFPPEDLADDYDNYADEVSFTSGRNRNMEKSDYETKVRGKNSSSTNGTNKTTSNDSSTNESNGNTSSTNDGKTSSMSYSDSSSENRTNNHARGRNSNVASLAQSLNSLANGAYSNLFLKCKRAGLFLGVY